MSESRSRKIKKAHAIAWGPCPCGCGTAFIELQDQRGAVFAKAEIDRADLLQLAQAFCVIAEHPLPPQKQLAS